MPRSAVRSSGQCRVSTVLIVLASIHRKPSGVYTFGVKSRVKKRSLLSRREAIRTITGDQHAHQLNDAELLGHPARCGPTRSAGEPSAGISVLCESAVAASISSSLARLAMASLATSWASCSSFVMVTTFPPAMLDRPVNYLSMPTP